jgi:hypothetical protein
MNRQSENLWKLKVIYIGCSITKLVHHDDFGFGDQLVARNHESVGEFVSNIFEGVRQSNASEAWLNDLDEVYQAQFYFLRSFDMASKHI